MLVGFLTFSCSKDDIDNDLIIGKWQPIEIYEADTQIELPICVSYMFTEYKNDETFYSGFLSNNLPNDCRFIDFAAGWTWKNLGNNQYRMKLNQEDAKIYIIKKREQNLIIEIPGENTITVYKPI